MIEAAFYAAMLRAGLETDAPIVADGRLHRFHVKGDSVGTQNGWYVLFADGVPAGTFGSWKTIIGKSVWCAKERRDMSYSERAEFQKRMERARQARLAEEKRIKDMSRQKAVHLWQQTQDIISTQAQFYLNARGINEAPSALRYHAACYHQSTKKTYPALIAAVTRWPDTQPCAVHRTYLYGSQKANIHPNKMMLGAVSGGAVRLGDAVSTLIVAEGIETALSVQQEMGIPAWAVLSAMNYRSLILPNTLKQVVIAADNDPVGISAAQDAAKKWTRQGLTVRVAVPPVSGMDFNDMLMEKMK